MTTRRAILSVVGTAVAGRSIDAAVTRQEETAPEYVFVQGDRCVPVQPIRGDEPVEAFYDYRLPDQYVSEENGASAGSGTSYSSMGTTDFQRPQTSIAFLYQGPDKLSLVLVHGSVDAADGGSVSFHVSGLPADGEWAVRDDLYRDPETGDLAATNYDRWDVDGTDHRIDWTWGSGGTDGGAFAGLGGDFDITVDPAFNDAAALSGEHYEGTVTDWTFVSGPLDDPEWHSLSMGDSLTIRTGSCEVGGGTATPTESAEDEDTETRETDEETEETDTETDDDEEAGDDEEADDAEETADDETEEVEGAEEGDDGEDEEDDDEDDDDEEVEDDEGEDEEEGDDDEEDDEDDEDDEEAGEEDGEDDEEAGEEDGEDDEEHTICHRPPGNPDNAQTKRVGSESAVEAHLGHGDSRGPCSADE